MENIPIELEIQRILDEGPTVKDAADFFVQKISAPETTDAERFAYWNFLFHGGFHRETLTSMCQRLNEKQRIHWGILVETLNQIKAEPRGSTIAAIFKGIKRQSAGEDLWGCHSWDARDPRFNEYRSIVLESKLKIARERRGLLVEKFQFLQSQRLRDQAARIIKRLIFLYPDDKELHKMKEGFDEEWAREVLSDKVYEIKPDDLRAQLLTEKEDRLIHMWLQDGWVYLTPHPKSADDFAILFLMADADEAVSQMAHKAHPSANRDWLIAELLFRLRRYVDLLEHLHAIEAAYLDDPETAFGVAYLRAQAMKEMGQSAAAVEILRNIVQVRPNYRSAAHLINEWSIGQAVGGA